MSSAGLDLSGKRIYVAGHGGMVGGALVRRLEREPCHVLTAPRSLDLRDQAGTEIWFAENRPDVVLLAAAKVGGILANDTYPGQFLYDNLMISANVIEAARKTAVEKLVYLGSSCIYPRLASQPIAEDCLLTGPLEPTNEPYAIAKIAGVKLCEAYRRQYGCDFISVMPTNLYGPGDNYHPENSHVLAALLAKVAQARESGARSIEVWGSGSPMREFLHVDDLADACLFLLRNYSGADPINVGSGEEIAIGELARLIIDVAGIEAEIEFDRSKPDGTPRKLLDSSRINAMGWHAQIRLEDGIRAALAALPPQALDASSTSTRS